MNTQSLRDGMSGLFSSLTQSVIKNLVDMATQALITNTILKSIMGIGGSLFGGAASASTGTAISSFGSSFSFNEKEGPVKRKAENLFIEAKALTTFLIL